MIFSLTSVKIREKTEYDLLENIRKINLRVPARASMWYTASSILSKGISALCTPIFTRLLTPGEYGLFPLYNTWLSVVTVIVTLELTGGVIYRGLQRFEDKKDEFISSAFGLFLFIFVGFCTLYFALFNNFNQISGLSITISSLLLLQIFANTVVAFYTAKARFEYRYKSVTVINLISAIAIPFMSVAIILLTNLKSEARIIASVVTVSIISVLALLEILKNSRTIFNKEIWIFLLKFNLPLLPHYLSMTLIIRISEITIGKVYGTDDLGRYSIALSVGMALTVITSSVLSALSPWILRKTRAREIDKIRDTLLLLTKLIAVLCLLLLAAVPELMRILTTPDFYYALPAVYPLALSVIPVFLSNAMISSEMYYEKSAFTAIPAVLSAGVSVALSLLLLPRVDFRFAGVFILISYILLTVLNTVVCKHLSGNNPINVAKTLTVFSLTLAYAALLFLLRNVFASRVILTLPLLPVLLILGKQAYDKIKE